MNHRRRIRINLWVSVAIIMLVGLLVILSDYSSVVSIVRSIEQRRGEIYFETDYLYHDGDLIISRSRQSGDLSDIWMYPGLLSLDDVSGISFSPLRHSSSTTNSIKGVGATLRKLKDCRIIVMAGCTIDKDTCDVLASMPRLEYVDLSATNVTDADLMELSRTSSIQFINVFESRVTDKGIDEFKKRRPSITVWNWYR